MEEIMNIFSNGWSIAALVTLIGVGLNFILKKYVTSEFLEKIGTGISKFAKGLGIAVTLGLSKIPYLKILWNNTIEPYVILVLDIAIKSFLTGFIQGMETDNKSTKE